MNANEMLMTATRLFAKADRMSADHAERLLSLLNQAPAEALEMLVANRVKFCWMPAVRRLRENFGYSDAQIKAL